MLSEGVSRPPTKLQGFCPGCRFFWFSVKGSWECDWASFFFFASDWCLESLLTHMHHALRHITYIQSCTYRPACMHAGIYAPELCWCKKTVLLFFMGVLFLGLCLCSVLIFQLTAVILPWHQRSRFSQSWTRLYGPLCMHVRFYVNCHVTTCLNIRLSLEVSHLKLYTYKSTVIAYFILRLCLKAVNT